MITRWLGTRLQCCRFTLAPPYPRTCTHCRACGGRAVRQGFKSCTSRACAGGKGRRRGILCSSCFQHHPQLALSPPCRLRGPGHGPACRRRRRGGWRGRTAGTRGHSPGTSSARTAQGVGQTSHRDEEIKRLRASQDAAALTKLQGPSAVVRPRTRKNTLLMEPTVPAGQGLQRTLPLATL